MMRHPVKAGWGMTWALAFAVPLGMADTTRGQETVLVGEAREGGQVFQTIIKRGAGNLRSEQRAVGPNSRIELHANVDDAAPPANTATGAAEPADAAEAGGHLIVRKDQRGQWRALGLTTDGAKARSAVKVLRESGIESAVFQFLPVPAEIQRLPLAPGVEPVGLAVRLNGEVFAVTKEGRLVVVPLQ